MGRVAETGPPPPASVTAVGHVDAGRYGPWALVAGGSEGLGRELVALLAGSGINVVVAGRHSESLEAAVRVAEGAGGKVRAVEVDLVDPTALARLRRATDDLDVGLLIHNAGANTYRHAFVDGDLDRFQLVARLNVTSRMELCHHYAAAMAARGRGGIMLVGSMAGYAGSPATSIYNAAKAFSRIFAEGLWYELRPAGVDVVEFVVGGMRTPAMERRGMTFGPGVADPADVAAEGLAHLGGGPVVVSAYAGGPERAGEMSGFPRQPVVEASAEGLRRLGLLA